MIEEGQAAAARQANLALTLTFWRLGRLVGEEVLGSERAAYGEQIVVSLGRQLVERYGRSYEEKNLRRMIQFAQQFHFAARTTEYAGPLEALRVEVEKHYTNRYLYELGNAWQQHVDAVDDWRSVTFPSQTRFFIDHVDPIIRKGKRKAVVIISDVLRYEVADELRSRIGQEDRFDATLDAMLSVPQLHPTRHGGIAAAQDPGPLPGGRPDARRWPTLRRDGEPQQGAGLGEWLCDSGRGRPHDAARPLRRPPRVRQVFAFGITYIREGHPKANS